MVAPVSESGATFAPVTARSARPSVVTAPAAIFSAVTAPAWRASVPTLSLAGAPVVKSAACYYTNSPDLLHFVGAHPKHERVIVATGDSGRGFKLAPVVGEAVAAMLKGRRSEAGEIMSLTRKVGTHA